MWSSNKTLEVYSERKDLTRETFNLLVELTLIRRNKVTAENKDKLYEQDQLKLAVWRCL